MKDSTKVIIAFLIAITVIIVMIGIENDSYCVPQTIVKVNNSVDCVQCVIKHKQQLSELEEQERLMQNALNMEDWLR